MAFRRIFVGWVLGKRLGKIHKCLVAGGGEMRYTIVNGKICVVFLIAVFEAVSFAQEFCEGYCGIRLRV